LATVAFRGGSGFRNSLDALLQDYSTLGLFSQSATLASPAGRSRPTSSKNIWDFSHRLVCNCKGKSRGCIFLRHFRIVLRLFRIRFHSM
jgi:hypothetical protein